MQAFHNTPSPGYIAWEDVHIQYKGTTYNIPNGNTDKRFVIWRYADPDCFYGSDEFPTLGPEDLLVFLNKNGTYAVVPKTQIVDGSLIVSDSIMTDAIAANAITTAKIAAGAITADLIAANAIGAGAIAAGAVTADKIAAGEIATTHLAALAVTADKIAANSVTADKVAAGAISAEKIAVGAITPDKLPAGYRSSNLIIENPAVTGTRSTWSGSGTVVSVDFNGVNVQADRITTSGNVLVASDYIEIDPSVSYEVSLWMKDDVAVGARYLGIYVYDKTKSTLSVTPVTTAGVKQSATSNFYFWNGRVGNAWKQYTGYMFAHDTARGWGVGQNVAINCILPPNARYVGLRYLNYYNAGTTVNAWFYNPKIVPVGATMLDADGTPIRALGNQIWLDSTGLKMKNADVQNVMMHLDANRLGFWDNHGEPSIGIGDVADMATALGSDMQYGLLLAQGEIRATEAVIRASLAEGLIGQKHVESGSVTLKKLSDLLSVTIPDRFQLYAGKTLETENKLTNPGFETGSLTGWTGTGTVVSSTVHSGSYAVNKANIYQDTPASSGQVWVGQAWVRDTGFDREYMSLQFLNSSKSVLSTVNSPVESGTSYRLLRAIGVAPANTAYARLLIKSVGTDTSHRYDDCLLAQGGVSSTYVTFASATISQTEACEQIKVNTEIDNPDGATIYTRVLVNGANKLEVSSAVNPVTASLTLDVRSIAGNITVQAQAKTSGSGAAWTKAEIMTNQRLPVRGAPPRYAVTSSTESSCGTTCEAACQATCQKACEADCQKTCQQDCQTSCQSICEQTSQGGGCWVAGTPVTVYLPKSETATDIPVEQLEPGMQMPYYDPATDTLAITECLSNQRSYTHTVFVAEVEGGWTLEMTREQPLDVLRPHLVTGQIMWHRLQARYLRVGDKLIRPFDKTLHEVLSVREEDRAQTWVWNPRTEARRYIVHGFADGISKT